MADAPSTSTAQSPAVIPRSTLQSLSTIDLIGRTCHQITGAKLPSNRQVLEVFFHNMRFVKLTSTDSARLAINAVQIYWQQERIPIRYESRCVDKLLKLYENWKNIQRTVSNKRKGASKKLQADFIAILDDLFDIAHADALNMMKIADDREFLTMQRKKGRPSYMAGIDNALYEKEQRIAQRLESEQKRKRTYDQMMKSQCVLNDSSSNV